MINACVGTIVPCNFFERSAGFSKLVDNHLRLYTLPYFRKDLVFHTLKGAIALVGLSGHNGYDIRIGEIKDIGDISYRCVAECPLNDLTGISQCADAAVASHYVFGIKYVNPFLAGTGLELLNT